MNGVTTNVESLVVLLGLAGVAAAINLAYMNLQSIRFRALITNYIQDMFMALTDSSQENDGSSRDDSRNAPHIKLRNSLPNAYAKHEAYGILYLMGLLRENNFKSKYLNKVGYTLKEPDLSALTGNNKSAIIKYDGFHNSPLFHKLFSYSGSKDGDSSESRYAKSPDQVLSASCFVVSISSIVLITGVDLNVGTWTLILWLLFVALVAYYTHKYLHGSWAVKLLPFFVLLCFGLVLLCELIFQYTSILDEYRLARSVYAHILFWALVICICMPITMVLFAHYKLPLIFKEIDALFDDDLLKGGVFSSRSRGADEDE